MGESAHASCTVDDPGLRLPCVSTMPETCATTVIITITQSPQASNTMLQNHTRCRQAVTCPPLSSHLLSGRTCCSAVHKRKVPHSHKYHPTPTPTTSELMHELVPILRCIAHTLLLYLHMYRAELAAVSTTRIKQLHATDCRYISALFPWPCITPHHVRARPPHPHPPPITATAMYCERSADVNLSVLLPNVIACIHTMFAI